MAKRTRVWEVDFIRGICLLLMFMDHAFYDMWFLDVWFYNFHAINIPIINALNQFAAIYWVHPIRVGVRLGVVALFFLLSGVSSAFSKNQGLRLLKLCLAAFVLAAVTQLADQFFNLGVSIYFGVLHCMALSLFIYIILRFLTLESRLNNSPPISGVIKGKQMISPIKKIDFSRWVYLGVAAAILVFSVNFDWLNLPSAPFTDGYYLDIILGFKSAGADCYGIFPYTGFFLLGCFVGKTLYANRRSLVPKGDCLLTRPVSFVGKNTLLFYLGHQPIILGIIGAIMLILGYRIAI